MPYPPHIFHLLNPSINVPTSDPNAMPLMTNDSENSFFIMLFARAIGSIGYGLSILALWVSWALPEPLRIIAEPPQATPPASTHESKLRRRVPSGSSRPMPVRIVSAPVIINPILVPNTQILSNQAKRVYFVDSKPQIIRRNTLSSAYVQPPPSHENPLSVPNVLQLSNVSPITSPRSSTSTLATSSFPATPPTSETSLNVQDQISVENETSAYSPSTSVLISPPRTRPRMKFTFSGKRRSPSVDDPCLSDNSELHNNLPKIRVNSLWPNTKNRKVDDISVDQSIARSNTAPQSPSPRSLFARRCSSKISHNRSSSTPPLPSPSSSSDSVTGSFFRKAQRRATTPMRRTLPYEAPYFASPPVLLQELDSVHLRQLGRFEDHNLGA